MNTTTVNPRRAYWLKSLHQWHWISSAITLVGLLLFSVTGITLNHVAVLDSEPVITNQQAQLPSTLKTELTNLVAQMGDTYPPLPSSLLTWSKQALSVDISRAGAEWSERELYLSMQQPGGDAWMSISLRNGSVKYQNTDRGWIAYLNDLHKGRYTGTAWGWFIDIIATGCLVFSITGLFILYLHAHSRPSTWPLVAMGLLIPVLIALLAIH
jgi:hypothetical protein